MFKFYLIVLFLVHLCEGQCQNIVTNGGFENVSTCPNNVGLIENAINWYNPTTSTPDLFHTCSSQGGLTPPSILVAFENPVSGGAYSEIASSQIDARDYIENELKYTLQGGKNYCINLFINHADSMMHKIDSMDIHLSDTFIQYFNLNKVIPLAKPTFTFPSFGISNINWENFSFIFNAQGGEKYITLGNFDNDSNTVYLNSGYGNYSGSYYLIDSVSISLCRQPFLGSDSITIYEDDQIMIGDSAQDIATYSWYPTIGLSQPNNWQTIASPTVTTTYTLTKITPCDTTYASQTIEVIGTYLNVFPNPANETISFSYGIGSRESAIIKLYDCIGRLVYQEQLTDPSGSSTLNLLISSGVYFLQLESGDDVLDTQKIVLMK